MVNVDTSGKNMVKNIVGKQKRSGENNEHPVKKLKRSNKSGEKCQRMWLTSCKNYKIVTK